MIFFFAALTGACIGSFLNALAFRLYEGWTLQGRSKCPHCQTTLRPHHLIPVVSWVLLRGKCAACHKRIHILYPLAEILCGCVWVLTIARVLSGPFTWAMLAFYVAFFSLLFFLALFDARYQRLPTELMVVSTGLFGAGSLALQLVTWEQAAWGALLGLLFFGAQVVLSNGAWMGSGDPVLGVLIGAVVGWRLLGWGMYLTYTVSALIVGCLWLLGLIRRRARIAFAPLLCSGVFLAWYLAPHLEQLLTRLLG